MTKYASLSDDNLRIQLCNMENRIQRIVSDCRAYVTKSEIDTLYALRAEVHKRDPKKPKQEAKLDREALSQRVGVRIP